VPPAVDTTNPVPYPFFQAPVFVAVDVESHERSHSKITEIGVATLDTRDLDNLPPGKDGCDWFSQIRARHFRIEDHKHLVNYEFVQGCPDRFEFGTSEFIPLQDVKIKLAECFKPPFASLRDADEVDGMEPNSVPRSIVLVGHDINTDVSYLKRLDFNPSTEISNLLGTLDSATLYSAWRRESQKTSLGKVLGGFDIISWNLHNAGNDAVYTIQAMLAVCVRESMIRGVESEEASTTNAEEEEEDDEDGGVVI
jgi:hypothetical protein